MRTTVDIDDELLAAARRRAAEGGTTLTAFIEQALAAALASRPRADKRFRLRWKPHAGRLRPGIDLSDRDALFDAMEGRR
jgi:Arc/MetJ family transcription regulator